MLDWICDIFVFQLEQTAVKRQRLSPLDCSSIKFTLSGVK